MLKHRKLILAILAVLIAVPLVLLSKHLLREHQLNTTVESDLYSQGQVAMNTGHCDEAIRIFQAMLRKDPRHGMTMKFLAECLAVTKDFDGALAMYERAVRLDPSPRSYQRWAELAELAGRKKLADAIRVEASPRPAAPSTGRPAGSAR